MHWKICLEKVEKKFEKLEKKIQQKWVERNLNDD
jgi:hypothetical protein